LHSVTRQIHPLACSLYSPILALSDENTLKSLILLMYKSMITIELILLMYKSMITIEEIVKLAERLLLKKTGKSLSFIQKVILKESLSETRKTYAEIALENNYSENYIKQVTAPRLWQLLSEAIGEKVNRTNCLGVLEQTSKNSFYLFTSQPSQSQNQLILEYPEGQVPLNSPFYIERDIELTCYQEILQPGSFLRIKAPRKMGKSSLMVRILAYGSSHNYHPVQLNLYSAETEAIASVERLLRWFCANVTQQLGLESKLEDYWDKDVGILISCIIYFQEYIFKKITHPIILAVDEVNQLFEYPNVARDFLSLLRLFYEKAKDLEVWRQKLRLLIVNSTDAYIPLETNRSPFNVGLVVDLFPFTKLQVEDLAVRHGLQLTRGKLEKLMELTGGFPYLVRLAFYHSVRDRVSLENLIQDAATDTGIFRDRLHEILWHLQQNPQLSEAFGQVMKEPAPISLEAEIAFKLKSLGLVHLEGKQATVSCGLYREYFGARYPQTVESRCITSYR
jgi:AAA-like domain